MADIGNMVAELVAAGCAPEIAAKVVAEAFTAGVACAPVRGQSADESADRRREKDRERKRIVRGNLRKSAESAECPNTPLSSSKEDNRKRGARLPDDWSPSADDREFAKGLGWSESQIDSEAANYRDYWIAKPGAGGCKLDWPATWRKWVRSSKIKPAGQVPSGAKLADKIPIEEAVRLYASNGFWSRHAPVSDVSQAPPEILAKHGLLPDGRRAA